MFSTDYIFRQQENLVDNQKCQAGFRPLCNKILLFQREKAITKHLSSSTEDLILLFKAEKNIVKFLKSDSTKELFNTKDIKEIIESYLKSVDFDETTETEDYVFHPVNAYHLLKRTTKWIPKLTKVIPNLDFEFHLPQGIMVHCIELI